MARPPTEADVLRIREMVANGDTYVQVRKNTGFSVATISRAARDVCTRQGGRPERNKTGLTATIERRIAAVRKALDELPGRKEVIKKLRMTEAEFEKLRYICRANNLPKLVSRNTGRPPAPYKVLAEVRDRTQRGESREAVLASLTERQRLIVKD